MMHRLTGQRDKGISRGGSEPVPSAAEGDPPRGRKNHRPRAASAETRRAPRSVVGTTALTWVAMTLAVTACAAGDTGRTPEQAERLAIRMAQVDAVNRLTEMVLAVELPSGDTVREALGPGSLNEIALRVFLRSARVVGPARVYSDGVAEVDVQASVDAVAAKVADLCGRAPREVSLESLRVGPINGNLSASGQGRAPKGISEEVVQQIASAPADELPEMFPAGWDRVTAAGRVLAARAARVAAYEAMSARLMGILLGRTGTVADLVKGSSAAEAAFNAYVRSLPVAGPPRLMPDGIAEVEVATPLAGLIAVLKSIRRIRGPGTRLTEEEIDRLSVQIKSERIAVIGRGMPPPEAVRPAAAPTVAGGEALPDWATDVLEAVGTADLSPDVPDAGQNRLLAARSAKVRALAALERQVDGLALDEGTTVCDRAAKDPVFRRDLETFLDSARTARSRSLRDGRAWEVVLRLPLLRLYEFSRRVTSSSATGPPRRRHPSGSASTASAE